MTTGQARTWRACLAGLALLLLPGAGGEHRHDHATLRPVPEGASPPTLTIEATADPLDGYNVKLTVSGFTFSPEHVGLESEAVEGHAHLYVNGRKVMRVYGAWAHLPMAQLETGENRIRVGLYDNLHRAWASAGRPVEAEILVAGPSAPQGREILLELDGLDQAPTIVVGEGEDVRLVVRAGEPGQLHLHGYDLEAAAGPDAPAVFAFRADHAGRFALVQHGKEDLLGRSERPVAYLEIRGE